MGYRRIVRVVRSVVIASAVTVAAGSGYAAAAQLHRSVGSNTIRFNVHSRRTSWAGIPGSTASRIGQGYPGEGYGGVHPLV